MPYILLYKLNYLFIGRQQDGRTVPGHKVELAIYCMIHTVTLRCAFICNCIVLKISDDEFGVCIVFSWLKNAVLLKKMCRSELWFSRNGFGHSCRAGRPGPNRERCGRGRRMAARRLVCPHQMRVAGAWSSPWGHTRDLLAHCGAS